MEENLDKDLKKQVEEQIECVLQDGINMSNLDSLGKLVDINKDLSTIKYHEVKEDAIMRRGRYGHYDEMEEYGRRGVPGSGRGRYGRRGVPGSGRGRYRGEDAMDEMMEHYDNYNEASEEMYRGNYGAEGGMIKSVEGIMKNIYEIVEELAEADSPEVMHVIKKYSKKISEMV